MFVREDRIVDSDGVSVALLPATPSGEDVFGVGVEVLSLARSMTKSVLDG